VLRFPDHLCVPPPDLAGRRTVPTPDPEAAPSRVVVHAAARTTMSTAPRRERLSAGTRTAPRTLVFADRRPPPGSKEIAKPPALGIRAIVHAKALEPLVPLPVRPTLAPGERTRPRTLAFDASITREPPG
jgi:hypothetical protein